MRPRILSAVLVLLLPLALVSPASADKTIEDGPESFAYVTYKDGKVQVRLSQAAFAPATKKVNKGGKEVEIMYIKTQWVIATHDFDAKKVKLYDSAGKLVPAKDLPTLLKKEKMAVLSSATKMNPFFKNFLKPDTYVIVIDPEAFGLLRTD